MIQSNKIDHTRGLILKSTQKDWVRQHLEDCLAMAADWMTVHGNRVETAEEVLEHFFAKHNGDRRTDMKLNLTGDKAFDIERDLGLAEQLVDKVVGELDEVMQSLPIACTSSAAVSRAIRDAKLLKGRIILALTIFGKEAV